MFALRDVSQNLANLETAANFFNFKKNCPSVHHLCLTLLGLIICALSACKALPLWVLIIGVAICAPQSFLIRKLDKGQLPTV